MKLKFEKLRPEAITPTRGTPDSAGLDLYYCGGNKLIGKHCTMIFDTGLAFEIPKGYFMYVSSRSGLAAKKGLFVLNSPGLIDSDYRGEICIILHNTNDYPHYIKNGDRLAQFVVLPYPQIELEEGCIDKQTERGDKGFGSTGL